MVFTGRQHSTPNFEILSCAAAADSLETGRLQPSTVHLPPGLPVSPITSDVIKLLVCDWLEHLQLPQQIKHIVRVNPVLHGACILRECIYGAHGQHARKENPNPNSHDHCLLSKWKCRTCVHTHLCN